MSATEWEGLKLTIQAEKNIQQ